MKSEPQIREELARLKRLLLAMQGDSPPDNTFIDIVCCQIDTIEWMLESDTE